MREIKFRAKKDDMSNYIWVYGFLAKNLLSQWVIITEDDPQFATSVIESTIGQYTGVKDAKGIEIYEGDVVEWNYEDIAGDAFGRTISKVVFYDGCFLPFNQEAWDNYAVHLKTLEVLGNIHDNSEMMEEYGD